jgi:hypothetical protein
MSAKKFITAPVCVIVFSCRFSQKRAYNGVFHPLANRCIR